MLVQLHSGVYDLDAKRLVTEPVHSKCRRNPHGFVGKERVMGFWTALRRGLLPHRLRFKLEHVHCEHCYDPVPHLELLLGQ